MAGKYLLHIFLVFCIIVIDAIKEYNCTRDEYEYQFTNCNSKDERWRIALPKNSNKTCLNLPKPVGGINCNFYCSSGHYFSMETLKCQKCKEGTYSLRNGARYEYFDKGLPSEFIIENYKTDAIPLYFAPSSTPKNVGDCNNGWVIQNGGLRYIPSSCTSKLTINIRVIKNGYIEIVYKAPRNSRGLISTIDVKDEQCQKYQDLSSYFSMYSKNENSDDSVVKGNDIIKIKKLNLREGQNSITWTITNNIEMTTLADVIYVLKIDIIGIAYTTSCTPCPPGTFSPYEGSTKCDICPENTFSQYKSDKCILCPFGTYSLGKSEVCQKKPLCSSIDFHEKRSEICFEKNDYIIKYEQTNPKICLGGTENLLEKRLSTCPVCSLGMVRNVNNGKCEHCKRGTYSSNGLTCSTCPKNFAPRYGQFITRWDTIPENIETTCEYNYGNIQRKCLFDESWIPSGEYFETIKTRDIGIVFEFSLKISSFDNPLLQEGDFGTNENPVAEISFDLELNCLYESCSFYFVEEVPQLASYYKIIATFDGTFKRSIFKHPILGTKERQFLFAFIRSSSSTDNDSITDYARIYSLNITNVGSKKGAFECFPCSKVNSDGDCESCPPGHFVNLNTSSCVSCPLGTLLNSSAHDIKNACLNCPKNMISENFKTCKFNNQLKFRNNTVTLDFKELKSKILNTTGVKIFTKDGHSYYHFYNVSLGDKNVICRDINTFDLNLNDGKKQGNDKYSDVDYFNNIENVAVCRKTAFLYSNTYIKNAKNNTNISGEKEIEEFASPFVLGEKIEMITQDRQYKHINLSDKLLEYSNENDTSKFIDTHIFFSPVNHNSKTCINGTITVITARCSLGTTEEYLLRLSKNCPDGTCDGCLYHMILETKYACPLCDSNDYQEIKGECIDGSQTIHYIPSKHCILSGIKATKTLSLCSNLSKEIKLTIFVIGILVVFLLYLVFLMYRKGKSIEYKYIRLKDEKSGRGGFELPIAESCGLEDGEEEQIENKSFMEKVFFKGNKYTDKNREAVQFEGFESSNLSIDDKDPDDDDAFNNISLDEKQTFLN
uniref:Ephrin_rec_like domain-containing protein n=1 Tax=Strongyloides papillosus TaxID=174720 RepID=A0A0N5BZG8_STREA